MLFSRRKGYLKAREVLQVDSIDDKTRNHLWTVVYESVIEKYYHVEASSILSNYPVRGSNLESFISSFWVDILEAPTDTIPFNINDAVKRIRLTFFESGQAGKGVKSTLDPCCKLL